MPITCFCPKCGTNLQAPDDAAGRKVKCPQCSTPFNVPDAGAGEPAAVSSAPAPPPFAPERGPQRREYDRGDYDRGGYERGDDDRYDDRYPRRESFRRQPSEGEGGGVQMGLGIASLSVGAGGLVIALIPCIGFYPGLIAGGVGLVLGLVGLGIAMTQKGRGIAFPIAGSATSVVALLVALLMYYLVYRAVHDTQRQLFDMQREMMKDMRDIQRDMMKDFRNRPPGFPK